MCIYYLFLCFIMCLLPLSNVCAAVNNAETFKEFLSERTKLVNTTLNSKVKQNASRITGPQSIVQFKSIQAVDLPKPYTSAKLFSLFNTSYVLLDIELYFISPSPYNGLYTLNPFVSLDGSQKKVSFVRSTEIGNFGIVLVAFTNGLVNIYGFKNETNYFIHSIETNVASDAHFFKQKGSQYLVITNNLGPVLAQSIIYKWVETHFDETQKITTRGAKSVTSFTQADSEIIVIIQRLVDTDYIPSEVYEFKNDSTRKIQRLNTVNPKRSVTYRLKDRYYLVIFDECDSALYEWTGQEFRKIFKTCLEADSIYLTYTDDFLTIFASFENKVLTYNPTSKEVFLTNEMTIDENSGNILEIQTTVRKGENVLIVITSEQDEIKAAFIPFYHEVNSIEDEKLEEDEVIRYMKDMDKKLEGLKRLLQKKGHKYNAKKIQQPIRYQAKSANSSSARASLDNPHHYFFNSDNDYLNTLNEALTKLKELILISQPSVEELFKLNPNDKQLNGKTIIRGKLTARKFVSDDVNIQYLNDLKWNTSEWLSYSKAQIIPGKVVAKVVRTNQLLTPRDSVFSDALRLYGNQLVKGHYRINNLNAKNLFVSSINGIPFEHIYLQRYSANISGSKQFDALDADVVQVNRLNKGDPYDAIKRFHDTEESNAYTFSTNVNVTNLNVGNINNINWNVFRDSVFRFGFTTQINGNIKMASFKSTHLFADSISGVNTDNFLTTTTNQTITSVIRFVNVDAENVICETVNGVNITKEAAIVDETIKEVKIQGPVKAVSIEIDGDMYIDGPINETAFHVQGTSVEDLYQFYHEKVTIEGDLYLNNILLSEDASVFVNEELFTMNMLDRFWLKNKRQVIPVHVTFENGLTAPHLITKTINNFPLNDYMYIGGTNDVPTEFYFENITILGNVYLNNDAANVPNFEEIDRKSVKYTGKYVIKGKKNFTGQVKIKNFGSSQINGIKVSEAFLKYSSVPVTGKKIFKEIIVSGDYASSSAAINVINDVDLHLLKLDALYVDKPASLSNMSFEFLEVEDLYVSKINGKLLSEYIVNMERLHTLDELDTLVVNGNVRINNALQLSEINNVSLKHMISMLSQRVLTVKNHINFPGTFNADNLYVSYVNDISFQKLLPSLLNRRANQYITAKHTFGSVKAASLLVSQINNCSLENLIDVRSAEAQDLVVQNGLELKNVKFFKSLDASFLTCDIKRAFMGLHNSDKRAFKKISVLNKVYIADKSSYLLYLLDNVVTTNGDNIIVAPVSFEDHVSTKNVIASANINGVNITHIAEDMVLKDYPGVQVITGNKRFRALNTNDANVQGNAEIRFINKIDIDKLSSNLVFRNDKNEYFIRGPKTFYSGLQADHLHSTKLDGVPVENLVSLDKLKTIPNATFDRLVIEQDLTLSHVNKIFMEDIVKNRLLCYSPEMQTTYGRYSFSNMALLNESAAPCINDIRIEEIIVDHLPQIIFSQKTFMKNVTIYGNVTAKFVNGQNLTKLYEQSVLLEKDANITGNINFTAPVNVDIVTAESINGISIDDLNTMLGSKNSEIVGSAVQSTKDIILQLLNRSIEAVKELPDEFMYIDISEAMQIALPNTVNAKAASSKDGMLLHVDGFESGEHCGLHSFCKCPVQHTILITPENSLNHFIEYGYSRSFSYHDDGITAHLFTNSSCVNAVCCSNSSKEWNEVSILTWTSVSRNASYIHPDTNITGYISDVEFFSLNGHVYAVICRYYDPLLDTHDLDCLVMKIIKDLDPVLLIQKIRTNAAKKSYLFYTAQGIVLVIGNVLTNKNTTNANYTAIYRFNPIAEQFELLRLVNTLGCTSAAGVVQEEDSLIILAHQRAVVVLKYDRYYNNYYIYQSFQLDMPILSISTFYVGGFGISDAYLSIVIENGSFYIYSFQQLEGWKLKSSGDLRGLQAFVPLEINHKSYLFAPSSNTSSLLTVIKHSYH